VTSSDMRRTRKPAALASAQTPWATFPSVKASASVRQENPRTPHEIASRFNTPHIGYSHQVAYLACILDVAKTLSKKSQPHKSITTYDISQ
jgi:hypothetical protein